MKRKSTRRTGLFTILLFLYSTHTFAQINYEFRNALLISGSPLTVGAVYKFSNVKAGVDANVTISNITGGISITNIDGGGGFDKALQPVLSAPALTNGYVELTINFFTAGTLTPMVQPEVPITPIDIDGQLYAGLPLYEYDEIDMPNGYTYFQYAGSELTMSITGTYARGKNNTSVDYPGIDTLKKSVMFTTVNANISSVKLRVGADNQSNTNTSRLRSLYFERFKYPHEIVLPNRTLLKFSRSGKNDQVELKGTLSASHTFDKIIVERSTNGTSFTQIGELPITNGGSTEFFFTFLDKSPVNGVNFYRVRLINISQQLQEISSTLMIRNNETSAKNLKIYNTILWNSNPALILGSDSDEDATIQIIDLAGRSVYANKVKLNSGVNNISLNNFNSGRGNFVIVVKTTRKVASQKIIIQ